LRGGTSYYKIKYNDFELHGKGKLFLANINRIKFALYLIMRIFAAIFYDDSVSIFGDEMYLNAYDFPVYLQKHDDLVTRF
jgi:hypothetical protein